MERPGRRVGLVRERACPSTSTGPGAPNCPAAVQALLRLVHIEQVDINRVKREDVEVSEYLKKNDPEMFKNLKKEARAARKQKKA